MSVDEHREEEKKGRSDCLRFYVNFTAHCLAFFFFWKSKNHNHRLTPNASTGERNFCQSTDDKEKNQQIIDFNHTQSLPEGEIKSKREKFSFPKPNKAENPRVMDRKDNRLLLSEEMLSVSQSNLFYDTRNIRLMIEELSFITERQQRPLTRSPEIKAPKSKIKEFALAPGLVYPIKLND